jgi:hypothetical protein
VNNRNNASDAEAGVCQLGDIGIDMESAQRRLRILIFRSSLNSDLVPGAQRRFSGNRRRILLRVEHRKSRDRQLIVA